MADRLLWRQHIDTRTLKPPYVKWVRAELADTIRAGVKGGLEIFIPLRKLLREAVEGSCVGDDHASQYTTQPTL